MKKTRFAQTSICDLEKVGDYSTIIIQCLEIAKLRSKYKKVCSEISVLFIQCNLLPGSCPYDCNLNYLEFESNYVQVET